ncbi:MAG TPA: GAF domain-containing protein [Bacillota bacterium]|nr:GAF domain-containing protein [Clostridiaceae bacterium]HNR05310.1 GAF domain-containing protein [Bacillota bacterium]HNT02336.1 GAF domain-containing protein [Bacillota bacterium]HPX68821.1 GAF domain-containing protein [Bacillota bacterium]HQA64595.1 GAF domain-containing protein [Bacillota bacterium]
MQDNSRIVSADRDKFYKIMITRLEGLLSSESDWLANLSNAAALLYTNLEDINWAGFYLMKKEELVLGPFQGKTACTRIKPGKGVCGTAAAEMRTQLVPDVHLFPGHIACDSASNSEIVVPLIKDGTVFGVLDIDSPIKNRFDELDAKYLQLFADKLNKYIDWSQIS